MFAIMVNDTLTRSTSCSSRGSFGRPLWSERPKSLRRVAMGTWGLTAALFAAFVVAGVRYDEIIDWGKVPPKKRKKPAVAVPIDAPADEKSMEEAIEDFTNQAGVEIGKRQRASRQKGNRQKMAQCVVIGLYATS